MSNTNRYRFRVISPNRESAHGKGVEVHGDRFVVLRVNTPDRRDVQRYDYIQRVIGLPLVILSHDQEIELVEMIEAEPKSGVEATG